VSYQDMTREELRDELKQRDLPVSGNKGELIDRLEEADGEASKKTASKKTASKKATSDGGERPDPEEESATDGQQSAERDSRREGRPRKGLKPMQLARLAAAQLTQLTGRKVDGMAGIEQTEEGWRVVLEIVEVARVPRSTDVLGAYEVLVDERGELLRYERLRRFVRSQAEEQE
jgi:hypothetical protein